MADNHTTRRRAGSLDDDSRVMLFEGCNLSELGTLFGMDHRVLVEKLHGVPSDGLRNGTEIWKIKTAAPYLVPVPEDEIDKRIKRMHHNDLPKLLTKEYWAGKRARQDYEEKEGDLWPTARVVKVLGSIMKLMKMNVRLTADSVDRESELTPKQRGIIKRIGDGMLREMHRMILEEFNEKPRSEQQVQEIAEELQDIDPEDEDEF